MSDSAKQDAGREEADFVIWYEGETGARIGQRGMTTPLVEGVARKAWMARAALVSLKPEQAMTDRQCRDIWRLHGGDFHGPITETGTMPESTLLPLIRLLWGAPPASMDGRLRRHKSAIRNAIDVDALAQEIRRLDGSHNLGAGALAEALMPFIEGLTQ